MFISGMTQKPFCHPAAYEIPVAACCWLLGMDARGLACLAVPQLIGTLVMPPLLLLCCLGALGCFLLFLAS